MSIPSAVFAQFASVTDLQTPEIIDRISPHFVHSMRLKKIEVGLAGRATDEEPLSSK